MKKLITIQPGMDADLHLPYPFHVFEDGGVDCQDFWRGRIAQVIGFQEVFEVQRVNLLWFEVVENPECAIGMYVVTSDSEGKFSVHRNAISHVDVTELPERYAVENDGLYCAGETLEEAKKTFTAAGGKLSGGYTVKYYLGNREPEITVKKARAVRA